MSAALFASLVTFTQHGSSSISAGMRKGVSYELAKVVSEDLGEPTPPRPAYKSDPKLKAMATDLLKEMNIL